MLKWIAKKRGFNGVVGIENRPDGIAVAHIAPSPESTHQLLSCDFVRCAEHSDRAALLKDHIDSLDLGNTTCNVVLPLKTYSLQLSDAPMVEPSELRDAIRWRIKDLLPMPIEEAVIDAFPLPEDTGRNDMVYAVAAHKQQVDEHIELIKRADLKLNAIDIAELGLRNISELLGIGERSVAMVLIQPGQASINLFRAGQLYLSRQFDVRWQGGLVEELPIEQLTLELQRSLDYFERQMRQVPPQQIYLCGEGVSDDKIPEEMRRNLSATIRIIELQQLLAISPAVDIDTLHHCIGAIGAALRSEQVAVA